MQAKDAIAAELLDDEASETDDEPVTEIGSRAGTPEFCTDDRDTDVDILTGDAE